MENFESLTNKWLDQNLTTRYKKSFQPSLKMFTRTYLIPAFGKLAVEEITDARVNEWFNKVKLQDGRRPSRQTLKHLINTLQLIIGRKINVRYPPDVTPKRKIHCPTDESIREIISSATGVYRVLFAMAAGTGMRSGELYGLHIEDIDFKGGSIHVRQSWSCGELTTTKTENSERHITIHPDLAAMMQAYKGERTSGVLLLSATGTPLHRDNVLHRHLHAIQHELELPQFGMHSFRHYSVSYCIRHGMSFDDVRMRHGHGSEDIMRMYLHLAPGHDARVRKMIPGGNLGTKLGTKRVA